MSILRSEWLTQGPTVGDFEDKVAHYVGAQFSVATNSATSALHLACLAIGVGAGDWVWTSPNTFVASANCALYCGANVDFVDIDPLTMNMSVERLEEKLYRASNSGRLPKVVIPVHFAGNPCDMTAIGELGTRFGFRIIEDASHAIGASYARCVTKDKTNEQYSAVSPRSERTERVKVGSCVHSDITVFSFHPVKIITTAEGGMALTNNEQLAERMSLMRSHGITRNSEKMSPEKISAPWYYEQIELGFNYRLSDLCAALGLSQLKRIEKFISDRTDHAMAYNRHLSELPLRLPQPDKGNLSSWHLYPVRILGDSPQKKHRKLFDALRSSGFLVNLHYLPVHLHPFFRAMGFFAGQYPAAEDYAQRAISLPLFPSLPSEQQLKIVSIIKKNLEH